MASAEIDLKTFHDVRHFLQTSGDASIAPPKPGAFALFSFPPAPKNAYDLVFEGIYLGEASPAKRPSLLESLGVTHVVNASQGTKFNQTNTDNEFYKEAGIHFHGIPALDIMTFKILPYLRPAAEFIHRAHQEKVSSIKQTALSCRIHVSITPPDEGLMTRLKACGDKQIVDSAGVVYVHCQQGVSRSATVVLSYLMLHWDMPLMTAARTIRQKREIFPNEGFLKQLCMLEKEIQKGSAS